MLDFTEQAPWIASPPVSSADTQTVSDSLPVISLADPATSAATMADLLPYMDSSSVQFVQEEDELETA